MALYDRREYWIINEDAFDERLSELDEYRFMYDKNGDMRMCRNNEAILSKTIACADPHQTFYPFFFLNGRIAAFSLIGLVSPTNRNHLDRMSEGKSNLSRRSGLIDREQYFQSNG